MLKWFLLALLPALPLLMTLLNLATWPRSAKRKGNSPFERSFSDLAVLIPARNESRNIEAVLASCLAQDPEASGQLTEIVVYDDQSTDDTAAKVLAFSEKDPRVRLLTGGPLPPGWVGKPHACQQLLLGSTAQELLFLDADVTLKEGALQELKGLVEEHQAKVFSAVPEQQTGTFFERLLLPLLTLTYTSWLPLFVVPRGQSGKTVAANGQLLYFSRATAERLGGFHHVRAEIVDDVAFCRRAKESGERVVFADGFRLARCRMYASASEVWNGFSKNIFEGTGGNPPLLLMILSLYTCAFVAPYAALLTAALGIAPELLLPASLGVLQNLLLRIVLAARFKQSYWSALLHPLGVLSLVLIALNSLRWTVLGTIGWKGRTYSRKNTSPASEGHQKGPSSPETASHFLPVRGTQQP